MIESVLWFDDVGVVPGLLPLLKGHICGQENEVGDGLGMRLRRGNVNRYAR